MHIEHVAYWVKDLEKMKEFYQKYFAAKAGAKYHNPKKGFYSYFLTFDSGGRLELMHSSAIGTETNSNDSEKLGITHLAFSVGSKEKVDTLTARLHNDGYQVIGYPRTTGDGYYESVILDPESNRIEITV